MHHQLRTASANFGFPAVSLALCLACFDTVAATREQCEQVFKPQTGQSGKDVIWVPTQDELVTRMLQMAAVKGDDLVYDLGAGDGKIAIAAAKEFGATAVGVEYNPDMAKLGQCYAEAAGVSNRVKIIQGDIFETDFSKASVVTLYLLPELNLKLRPTLLKMKPGTRVVSHSFLMGDWEPDERSIENGAAYLWYVPADVDGTWNFRSKQGNEQFTVRLQQKFQQLDGRTPDGLPLRESTLRGENIQLMFEQNGTPVKVDGRVNGKSIEATVTRGNSSTQYIGTRS